MRGLKERSDVSVVSTVARPSQLWFTSTGKEETEEEVRKEEEEEGGQASLPKTSFSVSLRLRGRSREESMLLLFGQSCV